MSISLSVEGLTKRFGPNTAVNNISFSADIGDVVGFLGPNGSGKSTTMKMIAGFLAPTAGTGVVCGHDVCMSPLRVKQSIGYLPEGAPAYPDMTPTGFLRFVAGIRGLDGSRRRKRVDEIIDMTRIREVAAQPIDTLSKGYKRRVGLAQSLLHDPPVLILDEPTDGLDPNQKHVVRDLIRTMAAEKCIVISTHILEEVDAVCTRTIVIANGRLLADSSPDGLRDESASRDLDEAFRKVTANA